MKIGREERRDHHRIVTCFSVGWKKDVIEKDSFTWFSCCILFSHASLFGFAVMILPFKEKRSHLVQTLILLHRTLQTHPFPSCCELQPSHESSCEDSDHSSHYFFSAWFCVCVRYEAFGFYGCYDLMKKHRPVLNFCEERLLRAFLIVESRVTMMTICFQQPE